MVVKRWPEGIDIHGDGLRIRIRCGKGKRYQEQFKCDPTKKSHVAAAIKRRDELKSRLNLGLPLRQEKTGVALFGDVAQDYLNQLDADLSTHMSYEGIINSYWMHWDRWLIADITRDDIKAVLADRNVTPKTKRNALIPLKGIFDLAIDRSLVEINPAVGIKLGKHQKPKIERFKPEERDILMDLMEGQIKVYFALFFGTGMRPGEMLALEWIDYDGEYIDVSKSIVRRKHKDSTKTHEQRTVYVPPWVRRILDKHSTRFKDEQIFLNSKGTPHLDSDQFNKAWTELFETREIKRKHKIRFRRPYTCRHTRAAEMLSTGVAPGEAAAQLGHTLEMFFSTYSEWIEEFQGKKGHSHLDGMGPKRVQGKGSRGK